MKELKMFVRRVSTDFLEPLDFKSLVSASAANLLTSTVQAFVLQASLVRPLKANGQKRLAFDASQLLEPVLSPLLALASNGGGQKAASDCVRVLEATREVLGSANVAQVASLRYGYHLFYTHFLSKLTTWEYFGLKFV